MQKKDEELTLDEAAQELEEIRIEHPGRMPDSVSARSKTLQEIISKGLIAKKPLNPKISLFFNAFLKNKGNITAAAKEAFGIKDAHYASNMGHYYYKKLKTLGMVYMEEAGYPYGELIKKALEKMEQSKTPEWWDRLMEVGRYIEPPQKQQQIVNIISQQKKVIGKYVEGEIEGSEDMEEIEEPILEEEKEESVENPL